MHRACFLIARDLRRMQVWASVNEADIAKVKPGTKVHFRVDALPDDVFHGTVVQMRLNASMTQNVVTYTVVIGVDNSDLKLLPYLTADVYFEVDERKDVLLVPNSALRFRPIAGPDRQRTPASGENSEEDKSPSGRGTDHAEATALQHEQRAVVEGRSGDRQAAAGRRCKRRQRLAFTEITGGDLHEGDEIVVGEARQAPAAAGEVTNPLGPPQFRGTTQPDKNSSRSVRDCYGTHSPGKHLQNVPLGRGGCARAEGHLVLDSNAANWSRSWARRAPAKAR